MEYFETLLDNYFFALRSAGLAQPAWEVLSSRHQSIGEMSVDEFVREVILQAMGDFHERHPELLREWARDAVFE
jgi:hypothetical protein